VLERCRHQLELELSPQTNHQKLESHRLQEQQQFRRLRLVQQLYPCLWLFDQ
tara:strand:+ start:153 stop:308 length:156 start_codon:yes stop_codon:yes gene_type:complete